jgi:TPR repeat protein
MAGLFYQQGTGVLPDQATAATYFEQAAMQGIDNAQMAIAAMYANGTGVTQNDKMAYVWLSVASTSSNSQIHDTATATLETLGRLMKPADLEAAKQLSQSYYAKVHGNH